MCGLTEYGKSKAFYNFQQETPLDRYSMVVVHGFKASIEAYSNRILLCSEVSHRLINQTTIWQFIDSLYTKHRSNLQLIKEDALSSIVGKTVLTKYNYIEKNQNKSCY